MVTIKLKFKLGQKVWSIQDNKIQELEVSRVDFSEMYINDDRKKHTQILYGLGFGFVDDYRDVEYKNITEDKIFKTKNELIKSLK